MPFDIWNRRYTGSKYKLANWITELISKKCVGTSFCDLFAGTGIISKKMLPIMRNIHINDFLYSNEIIYKAFFLAQDFDQDKVNKLKMQFDLLKAAQLNDNYVSINFGNKFFSYDDAKKIGFIREQIENMSSQLNEKEISILIASLLYSMDKVANTVGHYDAYIKGNKILNKFEYDLISPYNTSKNEIKITRKDANQLAKEIYSDIVYIDPPYNSRQYSRFYHVLENITCWEKPELFGVALKPKAENMSNYCRNTATETFKDLITNLNCNYIVVSYNNTYNSKSSSSRNKITLDDIKKILEIKGQLEVHEKPHPYFNAGKTDFSNHKEYIFIVKVGK